MHAVPVRPGMGPYLAWIVSSFGELCGVSTVPDCTRTYSRELLVLVEEEEGKEEDPLSYCSGASYGAYKYYTYRTRVPVT